MQTGERILVVEDGELLAGMLRSLFEDEGYEVVWARSIAEAAEYLDRQTFSLVLTDSFSGDAEGALKLPLNLCLRANGAPVALMTGHRVDAADALARGFCEVISKPFDLDDLLRRIKDCLNQATASGRSLT
jgi:DNA-binding NtrC family response regulator